MNFGLLVYARKNTRVSLSLDLVISRGLVTIFHQTRDDQLSNFGRNTRRNSTCFVDYVRTFCFSYDEAILLKSTNRVLTILSIHNISLRINTCNIETFASKTLISTAIEKYFESIDYRVLDIRYAVGFFTKFHRFVVYNRKAYTFVWN